MCQSVSEVSFAIIKSSLPGKATVIDSFILLFMVMLTFAADQHMLGEQGRVLLLMHACMHGGLEQVVCTSLVAKVPWGCHQFSVLGWVRGVA